jgi:hypothetical protein
MKWYRVEFSALIASGVVYKSEEKTPARKAVDEAGHRWQKGKVDVFAKDENDAKAKVGAETAKDIEALQVVPTFARELRCEWTPHMMARYLQELYEHEPKLVQTQAGEMRQTETGILIPK